LEPPPGKRYEPEFTQLPFPFLSHPARRALKKLVRSQGPEVLAYYIILQDTMGAHSDDDFTLSIDEMIDALRDELILYNKSDDDLRDCVNKLIDAQILEPREVACIHRETVEVRYCIPSVADTLFETRKAWVSKCINPLRLSKEDKARLKELNDKRNECRRSIEQFERRKKAVSALMDAELQSIAVDAECVAQFKAEIEFCDKEKARLYQEIHAIDATIEKINKKKTGEDE